MGTTIVRPADRTLRDALRLAAIFAAIKLAVHVAANLYEARIGYGYFRDEFYYIACGRHLAWGYVDHGPGVAVQARLALALFGRSLAGLRMLSAMAGAGRVLLTGMLCWAMGGRRAAQGLAMIGVLTAPMYWGGDSYLSMNSFESLFWMTCVLCLALLARDRVESQPRLWLMWGVAAGLGLLNKPSMTFFLVALLAGLLVTPQRRLLGNRWAAMGVAVMFLLAAPNLVWQMQHQWPTLEFLRNGRIGHKNIALGPAAFLWQQILVMQPANLLVWGAGLYWLLRHKPWRWMGWTFLFFLGGMMALHAKDYYVSPIYPMLFAAGGVAWEKGFRSRRAVELGRVFAFPVMEVVLLTGAAVLLPMALPVLRPATWVRYATALHLAKAGNTENAGSGPLPQFYADRFGWQEEVDLVTRAYDALPPQEQAVVCLWGSNYGEAGAIDFLGRGLPPAISGHNNYFLWGARGCTGEVLISVTPTPLAKLREEYERAEIVGHLDNPWAMPYEHRNVVLLRHRRRPVAPDWPGTKDYM